MIQGILKKYITDMVIDTVASKTGISKDTLSSIADEALPVITAAAAKQSEDGTTKEVIVASIRDDHDGSVFNQLGELINNSQEQQNGGILQALFGSKESAIENAIAHKTGVDKQQTKQVMSILGPLVMGALGQEQTEKQLDTDGILGMLSQTKAEASADRTDVSDMLALLDRDGDGDILDDIQSILKM